MFYKFLSRLHSRWWCELCRIQEQHAVHYSEYRVNDLCSVFLSLFPFCFFLHNILVAARPCGKLKKWKFYYRNLQPTWYTVHGDILDPIFLAKMSYCSTLWELTCYSLQVISVLCVLKRFQENNLSKKRVQIGLISTVCSNITGAAQI